MGALAGLWYPAAIFRRPRGGAAGAGFLLVPSLGGIVRSSSGSHYIALDHIRALAAFMVFAWHFMHAANGYPVPFESAPLVFPLALFDEGHVGVALFMTLSGYLFAKLLDGKRIHYRAFLWNRALRLLPLLLVLVLYSVWLRYVDGRPLLPFIWSIVRGLVQPSLPYGGWSITVEFHFYLILPVFLWLLRRSRWQPLLLVLGALALRTLLYRSDGEIQSLSYWTIVGRMDQFALGMMSFYFRGDLLRTRYVPWMTMLAFAAFYWWFDMAGGFYFMPATPSTSPVWIVLPTIEAVGCAALIVWYDGSFRFSSEGLSRFVGRVGEYSYSIYLLHTIFVFSAAKLVQQRIMDISDFYPALLWALVFFLLMVPIGYVSYRFIESPFLKLRTRYVLPDAESGAVMQTNTLAESRAR